MSEACIDPFENYFDVYEHTVATEPFLSSLPLDDRFVQHQAWRRVVEQPEDIDEFSDCLAALDNLRRFGINTPPYSAVIDTYDDGGQQFTLQVGHIEDGQQFDSLDFSDPVILGNYINLGHNLLNYYSYCQRLQQPYLTDVARVDQYLYGSKAPSTLPEPLLVDLELHTGEGSNIVQLRMFHEGFIIPLEQKSGAYQDALRTSLQSLS